MHCSGGWALLGSRNDIEWSLNGEQFLQEKLLGSPAFFSMSVGPDPNGGSKLCLTVRQPFISFALLLTILCTADYRWLNLG